MNFELFFKNLVFLSVTELWAVHYSCPEAIPWFHATYFPISPAHTQPEVCGSSTHPSPLISLTLNAKALKAGSGQRISTKSSSMLKS